MRPLTPAAAGSAAPTARIAPSRAVRTMSCLLPRTWPNVRAAGAPHIGRTSDLEDRTRPMRDELSPYGVVVLSVNVSVFEYDPVRSASLAPMSCLKPITNASLDTGALHVRGTPRTCSGCGSENAPLVMWPGSLTLSVAFPAVEITFAVVDASYVCATPAVNAPNEAAGPSVSDSVAGTVPPTVPSWMSAGIRSTL